MDVSTSIMSATMIRADGAVIITRISTKGENE